MKFNTKSQSANKQLQHISFPLISWFLKITFLLICLLFAVSFLFKKNPTLYTLSFPSPPIHHQEDKDNLVEILSTEESHDTPENIRPARRLYNFTDFSESLNKTGRKFWESINPSFDCPTDLLLKVGGTKDGGKWTCGINNLGMLRRTSSKSEQAPCLVYSFGVNRDSSFEAEVLTTTHCEVYAYDPSVDKIGKPLRPSNPRVHFKKVGISGSDNGNRRTLKTLMQENGGHKWIDILKMDVEYAEYPSLERILKDFPFVNNNSSEDVYGSSDGGLPFGQLLVEMHVARWNVKKTDKFSAAEIVASLLTRLEERGLRMFYKEINPIAGGHWFSEFSFINTNDLSFERFLGNE